MLNPQSRLRFKFAGTEQSNLADILAGIEERCVRCRMVKFILMRYTGIGVNSKIIVLGIK
ncbi:hypothetical protein DWQ65_03830 [Treponema phagedenis]|nr:hypothetical protein HMPREF9554_01538 [Treponema phagedenis F0421]QSH94802.1 hypothetical protein C5O78_07065 [Treponema phagedenis]QSH99210.1 hypothetical protein DWQ65_03830 [Treponema phagedenis]